MIGFLKKVNAGFLAFLFSGFPFLSYCLPNFPDSLPDYLSKIKEERDEKFSNLEPAGIKFYEYSFNCPSEELKRRFDEMTKYRWQIYFTNPQDLGVPGKIGIFNECYKSPENWEDLDSRFPYPTGLYYNIAHKNYNAAIVCADGDDIFLAIEAPSSKNIDRFFELMSWYKISSLVSLNSSDEYGEDFYRYWEETKFQGDNKLKIGENIIDFYRYSWPHKQSTGIEDILSIANRVLNNKKGDFMAVSCRAGAGRTGTYICSYLILREIKKQLKQQIPPADISLNIDKIIWQISVQRPFSVTHFPQYEMLYRFADYCLENTELLQ